MAGTFTEVPRLPECDFCGAEARFDFRTVYRPWANGCGRCFFEHGPGQLGTGHGQLLVRFDEAPLTAAIAAGQRFEFRDGQVVIRDV